MASLLALVILHPPINSMSMKRKNPHPSHSKKVRIKIVEDPANDATGESDGVAAAGPSQPLSVKVENFTFVSTPSGRFAQTTIKWRVLPNPVEFVLQPSAELDGIELEAGKDTVTMTLEGVTEHGTDPV